MILISWLGLELGLGLGLGLELGLELGLGSELGCDLDVLRVDPAAEEQLAALGLVVKARLRRAVLGRVGDERRRVAAAEPLDLELEDAWLKLG